MIRCSSVIRLDQQPLNSCFKGSGLPMPPKGSRSICRIKSIILKAVLRSCFIHHAKSSKALRSNSKFLTNFLKRYAFFSIFSFQNTLPHIFAFQKISGFFFRFNFAPNFYRHNHADRVANRIRNILNFLRHKSSTRILPKPLLKLQPPASSRRRELWRLPSSACCA